ncbi:OPT oligopeptide transporter protein-domain-containing protein [Dipodascopsis uninucleata]
MASTFDAYEEGVTEKDPGTIEQNHTDASSSNGNSIDEKKGAFATPYEVDSEAESIVERMKASGEMDDILADDGGAFFIEKMATLNASEAYDILTEALEYHKTDINFPEETLARMRILVAGEQAYGQGPEIYNLDLRLEAVLMKHHSPYPEVRSVCSPTDDPSIPTETFRAYVIGTFWVIVGTFINQLIYFRQPHFTLTSQVVQILLLPCGQFFARVMPNKTIGFGKYSVKLNPGPWTFKEQMFATIITNVGSQNPVWGQYYPVVREQVFYGQTWANFGFTVCINIICQFFGFGMAGVLRRWVVYPSKAVWPTMLPTLQLNKTLLLGEHKRLINGWSISKYKLFNILLAISFVYFFIPDYLFTATSIFNWMTWIAPKNKNLAFVTGSTAGVGFNPIPTFDWSVINYANCMIVPFFSTANTYFGTVLGALILLGLYYSNVNYSAYLPPNTSSVYDRYGKTYNVTAATENGVFDLKKYEAYSPPYLTAGYYMYLCASYTVYMFAFVYIFVMEWQTFRDALVGFWQGIRFRKSSNYEKFHDPLSALMKQYKEVPDWWFLIILALSVVIACIVMHSYPTGTPVWAVIVIIGIAIAILIPCMVLYASTGFFMSTNMLGTILGGYLAPGNGVACVFIRALGFCVEDQSETYVGDQKLAHYSKLPPRAVFRGQLLGTIIQIFVTAAAMELAHGIEDFCSYTQSSRFYCTWSHSIYSGTLLFGVIGPDRTFNTLYPIIKWCFLIGALAAVPVYLLRQRFPKYLRSFHPVLVLGGLTRWGSSYNLTYYTGGFYFSFYFMYYVRTRYLAWWSKYNYVISCAITAGISFSGILIFLALQYRPKSLVWWGNKVSSSGVDTSSTALLDVPELGYFGIANGTWH